MTPIQHLAGFPSAPAGRSGWPWTTATDPAIYASPPAGGSWPKITIVTPSFNQGAFIEEAIRSVLLQNYPALEYIVMDGGSTDGSPAVLARYAPWLARWESTRDHGQSHALNKGYAAATGALYGWINSDDYYLPEAFATVARLARSGNREFFFGDWAERTGEEPALRPQRGRPAFRFQVAVGGRTVPSHAAFWPAAIHQPLDEHLRFTMDADLFKRLAAAGARPRHIPRPLAVFRQHAAAKSSTIVDVARAETKAWGAGQPWHVHWQWRISRLVDRFRR
jgi:glycosyltransferase involved in cell wall biosynthesis